jgi:hypothetical protein
MSANRAFFAGPRKLSLRHALPGIGCPRRDRGSVLHKTSIAAPTFLKSSGGLFASTKQTGEEFQRHFGAPCNLQLTAFPGLVPTVIRSFGNSTAVLQSHYSFAGGSVTGLGATLGFACLEVAVQLLGYAPSARQLQRRSAYVLCSQHASGRTQNWTVQTA